RYNHGVGDLVLHPFGYAHWPGRLRPPYAPFAIPEGMRRSGTSLVYCAGRLTEPAPGPRPRQGEARADDARTYAGSPPLVLAGMTGPPGVLAQVGDTRLELVEGTIRP